MNTKIEVVQSEARGGGRRNEIHWRSIITGVVGYGTILFTKDEAEQIVRECNKQFGGRVIHWYEETAALKVAS